MVGREHLAGSELAAATLAPSCDWLGLVGQRCSEHLLSRSSSWLQRQNETNPYNDVHLTLHVHSENNPHIKKEKFPPQKREYFLQDASKMPVCCSHLAHRSDTRPQYERSGCFCCSLGSVYLVQRSIKQQPLLGGSMESSPLSGLH